MEVEVGWGGNGSSTWRPWGLLSAVNANTGGMSLAVTMSKTGWHKGLVDLHGGPYVHAAFDLTGIYNATDIGVTEVVLKNGLGTRYGLGVSVRQESGRRAIEHGGEVSGFTAHNMVFPDERVAVVVLTNQDSVDASGAIARKIAPLLFLHDDASNEERQSRAVFEGLQQGKIDRSLFTDNANSYFTEHALRDFASSLGPLGAPQEFSQTMRQERGGMTFRLFEVRFPQKTLEIWERIMPDGKVEQYQVATKN